MKELVILSGKGGTGKTSLCACFAVLAGEKVICDADVDAPDLHLLLHPEIREKRDFWGREIAFINKDRCDRCGVCMEACRFGAIRNFEVDPQSCEGCRLCFHICPRDAVEMKPNLSGHLFISDTKYGPFVHARLDPGEENSGKLVAEVRGMARGLAEERGIGLIITDGPPGIGCPVISSLSGASLAVLVTEPTLSGIYDLERVLGVARHFGVKAGVVINKYDLDEENTRRIENFCQNMGVEVLSRLPFDEAVPKSIVMGIPVVEYTDGRISREIEALWRKLNGG